MKIEGKVVIAQGGGPTAVINQSLVGVVLEARKFARVSRIYGAVHGVEGIINENFLDLTMETTHNLEQVAMTPSSALLSTRIKPEEKECKEMFQVMKAHNVRYFFYIGGNDSSETVRIINEEAKKVNYDFRAIHIPKTIDNDLVLNDHTPGYGSAARYVTQAFTGINLDNLALPGVYIGVVMGRDSGFMTAASCLAQKYPGDGPHLIYLPERPFHRDKFLQDVKSVYDKQGRCIIAVSEGIKDADGETILSKFQKQFDIKVELDPFGHPQLSGIGALGDLLVRHIKENLKIKRVIADTLGYLQRSFIGCVSDVDQQEAREVGEKAVQHALWYNQDGSIAIKRTGFYSVEYKLEQLVDIAGKTKHMANEYINSENNGITDAFRHYVRPLVGSALPTAHRLRVPTVKKLFS